VRGSGRPLEEAFAIESQCTKENAASDDAEDEELLPLGDGWFAAGEERDPRRIRFLGNGAGNKAIVAEFNGGSWFRSFED